MRKYNVIYCESSDGFQESYKTPREEVVTGKKLANMLSNPSLLVIDARITEQNKEDVRFLKESAEIISRTCLQMLNIIHEDDLVKENVSPVKEEAATSNYNLNDDNGNASKSVYTVDEIKDILGVGINKAYLLVNRGDFPVKMIGKRKLIPVKPFHDWLDQQN